MTEQVPKFASTKVRPEPFGLELLKAQVIGCKSCPRLVEYLATTSESEQFWAKPVPGFGDPNARIAIVGLAPSLRGSNRTGRMFTGDRSADFLAKALFRSALSNQDFSTDIDDLYQVTDTWITAALRCAPPGNKPTSNELAECRHWLNSELGLLSQLRVIVALGAVAFRAALKATNTVGTHHFAHGIEIPTPTGPTILASFHPSPQNTNTGRLDPQMFDEIFSRAKLLAHS